MSWTSEYSKGERVEVKTKQRPGRRRSAETQWVPCVVLEVTASNVIVGLDEEVVIHGKKIHPHRNASTPNVIRKAT